MTVEAGSADGAPGADTAAGNPVDSTGDALVVDGDKAREWNLVREYRVTEADLAAYAAATNDTNPGRAEGLSASPAYPFVPFSHMLFSRVDELIGVGGIARLVHMVQQFTLREEMRPGDDLTISGGVGALRPGPFGGVVDFEGVIRRADGTEVNSQVATLLIRDSVVVNPFGNQDGGELGGQADAAAGANRALRGGKTATVQVDADQPARYSVASGDYVPIHIDRAVARRMGFPNVILQGMCTLAMSAHALELAHPHGGRVTSLRTEFARPVFPGDRLTVRWMDAADGGDTQWEVLNRKQRGVLRGGLIRQDD